MGSGTITLFMANTTYYYYYSPVTGNRISRRDFLKLMVMSGVVMTFAPFVDWGKFLSNPMPSISNRQG
jgi:rieske iron-sulfur protein